MAIAYVSGVTAGLGVNGGTTSSIDSTGASLLVVVVSSYNPASEPTLTDSKGNTWTGLTAKAPGDGGQRVRLFYAANPSVGTSHTFTLSGSGTYSSVSALAFSGAKTSAPFDVENGAIGASPLSTGSVTPSEDDELVVAGISLDSAPSALSIGSGFSTPAVVYFAGGSAYGVGSAYKIQTTAAAVNPAWSWTGGANECAAIATFKVASGSTYSATSALTTAPATTAIAATATPPTFSASSALATAPATLSAAGTATPPTFSGSAALVAAPATLTAEGTAGPPTFSATAALTAGPATSSSAATATPPTFTASAALTAGAAVLAAAGTTGTLSAVTANGLRAREGYALRAREGYALTVREGYSLRTREG